MISSVVYASPRARLVSTRHGLASAALVPATAAAARCLHHQHKREFGSGSWFSEMRSHHRDVRRRHRQIRYRQLEQMNRKLSWENGPPPDKTIPPFLRSKAFADAKYTDAGNVKSWSDDLSGIRPGKNIEDVEREAMDKLFRSHYNSTQHFDRLRLPFQAVREYIHAWSAPPEPAKTVDASQVIEATSGFPPVYSDADLKGYSPSSFDDPNAPRKMSAEETSKRYKDLNKYRPVEWNEPDGLQKPTAEELSKNYKDLDKYSPAKFDAEPTAADPQAKYDDLHKYKPAEWNEPDGLPGPTAEELTKNYNDLDKYNSVRWNEPDGLPGKTPEELSKNYKDLDSYGPSEFNEPEGLRPLTAEEESKKYEDLDKYAEGFMAKDSVLDAHEAKQMDTTVRGNMLPPKIEVVPEDLAQKYDDLGKYGPVLWNEPDGLRPLTEEELSKNYDDLHKYAQYDNGDPDVVRIHPEEASKQYEDLYKYAQYDNDGPAEARIHPEEASKQYADLPKYPRAGYEEPIVKEHIHPEELTKNYPDLAKYNPATFDAPHKPYPAHPDALTNDYDDLNLYKPVFHNEPDGKAAASMPVKDGLAEYDTKHQKRAFATTSPTKNRSSSPLAPQAHRRATNLEFAKVEYENSFDDAEIPPPGIPLFEVGTQARQRFVNLEEAKDEYQSSWKLDPTVDEYTPGTGLKAEASRRVANLEKSKAKTESQWDSSAVAEADGAPAGIEAQARRLVNNLEAAKSEYEAEWDAVPTAVQAAEDMEAEYFRRVEKLEKSKAKTESAFDSNTAAVEADGAAGVLESGWDVAPAALESIEAQASRQAGNADASKPVLESGWDVAPAASESIEEVASRQPAPADESVLESGWDVAPSAIEYIEAESGRQPTTATIEPVLESGWDVERSALESIAAESGRQPAKTEATEPVLESGWNVAPSALASIEAEANQQPDNVPVNVPAADADAVLESGWDVTPAAIESIEVAATQPPTPFQPVSEDGPERAAPAPTNGAIEIEADLRASSLDDARAKYETAFERQVDFGVVDAAERDEGASSMDESFPLESAHTHTRHTKQRLSGTYGQPSMNPEAITQAEADPYSKSPQGLETSYSEETGGRATWPTMVRHYRTEGSPRGGAETASGSDAATYVVLAFDPLTHSVNVAETSSGVEHVGSAMTPAEAILRLSNPSKFFPHFQPLQEQGYEIVSGRGDVLIFRKVRADTTNGRGYEPRKHMRKKRSFGRKLVVGTLSVAGAAYAIGVLGEYVSTRGIV
ncbi:hypothetical protein K4F52_004909 [Lecanicillium sp. MT-2017a]|nr:hypothetical protein K4F52_004909 [Lecanicillium sp. MT-2017a]